MNRNKLKLKPYPLQLGGEYKCSVLNVNTGEERDLTGWFSNLITDVGLDNVGQTGGRTSICQIGTGTGAPSFSDTALQAPVASTGTVSSTTSESGGSATPGNNWHQWSKTFQFAQSLEGNFTELGISNSAHTNVGAVLWSRELIRDSQGNPTTITVLEDEILQVTYRLRMYFPLEDIIGQVNIAGVDYDYILRRCLDSAGEHWAAGGQAGGQAGIYTSTPSSSGRVPARAYSGDISAGANLPDGPSSIRSSGVTVAYEPGSLERLATLIWGLTAANFELGLRSIVYTTLSTAASSAAAGNGWGAYQIQFDPPIPKDNTLIFEITVGISWARYAPPE